MSLSDVSESMRAVWPLWQRILHWLLAASVILALVQFEGGPVHEKAGYVALACALVRVVLGFAGPSIARFRSFVIGPRRTWAYGKSLLSGRETRHLNHNPLGAYMVLALLLCAVLAGATGWLYTTERFWGYAWLINLHAFFSWAFVVLVPLHLAGVAFASLRHRENLIASMLHGKKRVE